MQIVKKPTLVLLALISMVWCGTAQESDLSRGFANPGNAARPKAYWNWLNGDVRHESLTRDLEEAKAKGLGGLQIWDTEAMVNPNGFVPAGPPFMGKESVAAIRHALKEAKRLDLDLGLITSSGWNAGGPWVPPELASKNLFYSSLTVEGSVRIKHELKFPEVPAGCPKGASGLPEWYIDVAVLAWPDSEDKVITDLSEVINLTDHFSSGVLSWTPPTGKWQVVRYVCTNNGQQLIAASPNSKGPFIDFLDPEATRFHFRYILEKLGIKKGGDPDVPLKTLDVDSMELHEGIQWTTKFGEWFLKDHGYDPVNWLPVLSGWTIESKEKSDRFTYDFNKSVSDLLIFSHYTTGSEICAEYGLKLAGEAGGPGPPIWNTCPVDALKALGNVDIPRGEFWIRNRNNIFLVKEIASASHIYGKPLVDAESWTTWWRWKDGPFVLKQYVDRAFCEGLNHITYHGFSNSPDEFGYPGRSYHAGVDMNPRVVWWSKAKPFMDYLARCCHMLQQGLFVADVAYYYGDQTPNFWPLFANVPEKPLLEGLGKGYDYDVVNSDVILNRMSVEKGRLRFPNGMSYRVLVLPDQEFMQLEVLQKLGELVSSGATVIGPKPVDVPGLRNHESRKAELQALADKMWGPCNGTSVKQNRYGKGKVVWGYTAREWLEMQSVGPDFLCPDKEIDPDLDYIHRQTENAEIYFVRNKSLNQISADCLFRIKGLKPSFWEPTDGTMKPAFIYDEQGDGTVVRLDLAPGASVFVVFGSGSDSKAAAFECWQNGDYELHSKKGQKTKLQLKDLADPIKISGEWKVTFDPAWGAPAEMNFPELISWSEHENQGIKYYSGAGFYLKTIEVPTDWLVSGRRVHIDLGDVREVAEIFVNGKSAGVVWKPPYRADISKLVKAGSNDLKIEVMNLWCNRLAGDNELPEDKRFTKTNIKTHGYRTEPNYWMVQPAGLLGPVRLVQTYTIRNYTLAEKNIQHARENLPEQIKTEDPELTRQVHNLYIDCLFDKLWEPALPGLPYKWFSITGAGDESYGKCQLQWDPMFVLNAWAPLDDNEVVHDVFKNYWNVIDNNPEAPKGSYKYGLIPCTTKPDLPQDGNSQIPILAWGCMMVFNQTNDFELLELCIPYLDKFLTWYATERDVDNDGLIEYGAYKRVSIGDLVQTARFETFDFHATLDDLKLTEHPTRGSGGAWYGNIEGVEQTSFLAMSERAMIDMCQITGRNEMKDKYVARLAKRTEAIRTKMWDPETKFFYSLNRDTDKKIPIKTMQGFLTLTAGLASEAQAKELVRQLTDPSLFWSKYPVTTSSMDEPTFKPDGFWRGDMWPPTNYLVALGLNRYGYYDIAIDLADKMQELLKKYDGHAYERYNGVTGDTLGVKDYCWGVATWSMAVNTIYGIQEDYRTIVIPPHAKGRRLKLGKLEVNYPTDTSVELNTSFEREFRVVFPAQSGKIVVNCNGKRVKNITTNASASEVTFTALPGKTYMVQAAIAVDEVPKRLPGIPTNAAPYSDYAPYLCYPGSDKYYSFPGIRDPWVFNRAMVWLEQKDGVDGPPICYSGGESLWLSGKQQASIWRGGTITQNADNSTTFLAAPADEGVKLPFFTGPVDPEIMKLSIGHACTSPFQFNLEQHPKAILEVTDASAPWRFMVVLKGREGKPSYICDWKTGAGNLEVDLRGIYRKLGYQGNFAHVYFLLSVVGSPDKPGSATFKLHMAGDGAVISSLPVIRTDQRQRQEGVPLACIVVDEQARKLGEGTVVVKARVNGKTYAMQETGGIWRTRVQDLPMGDHRASLEAEWPGGEKKRVAMLDVSITDGKFIGFDTARSLLTYDGKPMPPMAGSETGKLIYEQPDTPNESLVCGEKEWSEVVAAAKGGKLDIADRWWEGLNEKDQEKQAEYLASCGFNLMHLSSWWHHWERTEYLDHVTPYGAERLAGTLRANRKHGVFLYFNLANHHPTEDGCVPYQQQVDAGIQKWSYSLNSGWVKTYLGYAAAFARLFCDETSLLAVSANGERDRDTRTGTRDFVNQTYDIYTAEDPNHLVITEFDVFEDPMACNAFKPKPAGFRTYTCHDRDRPYAELNIRLIQGKYKAEMMRPHPYQAEGNFWGFLPTELHGFEGDSYTHNRDQGKLLQSPKALNHYRMLTREETYLALVYRISMCMSWGECIIEDERKVHQDVRQRVDWTQEWKPAPVAIRVKAIRDKSIEPDLFGCARLIDEPYNYEERMNALSLETTYLWGNTPVPDGVAHVIDLNKQSSLNPAFASEGGDLPDRLKEVRPIVVPGGQTHYSWSRDGRTLLAYLPGQNPGSTVKLQGFPDEPLHYRLYDLDKKEAVATGSFQKSGALTLPGKGNSFFLLITP